MSGALRIADVFQSDLARGVSGRGPAQFADLATLSRIRSLQLRARVIVEGFYAGIHRSPYHGFSVEFSEYRPYSPGDDLRSLDWRLLARTDRLFVKRFEDETNLVCHLLVDVSRSMDFGTLEYTKLEYARTLAATLAFFLDRQRDATSLTLFHQTVAEHLPARFRPGSFRRVLAALSRPASGTATDMALPLEQIAQTVRKRGLVVLISDLLVDPATLAPQLRQLRSRGHDLLLFRVLDPAERDFPFAGSSIFRDLESGKELYVDPEAARRQYLERFAVHAEALGQACRDAGAELVDCPIDRPLELGLIDLVQARLRRGRRRTPRRGRSGAP